MGPVRPIRVRGLLRLHSAVPAEPPVGPGRPTGVKAPELITVLVLQRLVLPVRLMPTETAAPIRYGQLTAIIPAMTNAEPASHLAR